MKLSLHIERELAKIVKKKLKGVNITHGFDHTEYVVALAKKIANLEGANLRIVVPAAYLHDIVPKSRVKKFPDHSGASATEAERILKRLKFNKKEIDAIKGVIRTCSYSSYLKGCRPKTLEAKVLRDADWIEALGARGIARVFAMAAPGKRYQEMGKVKWTPRKPTKLKRYLAGMDPSPIYHFFSKLLWIKNNMQTKTGKKLAKERHEFIVKFLEQYKKEVS